MTIVRAVIKYHPVEYVLDVMYMRACDAWSDAYIIDALGNSGLLRRSYSTDSYGYTIYQSVADACADYRSDLAPIECVVNIRYVKPSTFIVTGPEDVVRCIVSCPLWAQSTSYQPIEVRA